jgi:hypothetical protein
MRHTLEAIAQAIASKSSGVPLDTAATSGVEIVRETVKPKPSIGAQSDYVFAKLSVKLHGRELRDVPAQRMADWVWQVVEVESPVHFDEVVRRIRDAAGLAKAGDPIREAIQRGVQYVARQEVIVAQEQFLWRNPIHPPSIRNRSALPSYLKKLELVHPEEIKAALKKVIEEAFGISSGEAIAASTRLLGFERVTESMRQQTEKLISELLGSDVCCEEGGKLRISNRR